MSQQLKDLLELHFLVVLWGFTAVLGLLIHIPAVEIVLFRTLISFVVLGLGLYLVGRSLKVTPRECFKLFIVGALFAAHWILFFLSAKVSNASLCLAGMATTALWSGFLEPMVEKRKVGWLEVVMSTVAIMGILIVLNVEFDRALGLALAIASAFLTAIFTIANKYLVRRHEPFKIMFYEMLGAFLTTLIFLPVYQVFFSNGPLQLNPSIMDWIYLSILAVICTVYAYTMSVKLLKRISVFTINFTLNLEPVYGIVLAFLILGDSERMTLGFYLGTLIILASVIAYPIIKERLRRSVGVN